MFIIWKHAVQWLPCRKFQVRHGIIHGIISWSSSSMLLLSSPYFYADNFSIDDLTMANQPKLFLSLISYRVIVIKSSLCCCFFSMLYLALTSHILQMNALEKPECYKVIGSKSELSTWASRTNPFYKEGNFKWSVKTFCHLERGTYSLNRTFKELKKIIGVSAELMPWIASWKKLTTNWMPLMYMNFNFHSFQPVQLILWILGFKVHT